MESIRRGVTGFLALIDFLYSRKNMFRRQSINDDGGEGPKSLPHHHIKTLLIKGRRCRKQEEK